MTEFEKESRFAFPGGDRRRWAAALAQATEVRHFRRLQAVRQGAEGVSVNAVAQRAKVDRRTVPRWVQTTYGQTRQPASLAEAPRAGRPREANDLEEELLAEWLARDPRSLGYRATSWTAPLLRRHLQEECGGPVSERTLRRRLHEYGWNGKRLRYRGDHRPALCGARPHGALIRGGGAEPPNARYGYR